MGLVASRIFVPNPREEAQQIKFLKELQTCLMKQRERECDVQKLQTLFDDEFINAILKIPIPISQRKDRLVWVHEKRGTFTVKSAYGVNQGPLFNESHMNIWKAVISINNSL